MAKDKGGSKIIRRGKNPGTGKKINAGNHNSAGMMMKHSPKAMRGQGKC